MIRNVDFDEISDGKKYGLEDMVRADCNDCKGCHACCENMGDSVILDPLDIYNLVRGTKKEASILLTGPLKLTVCDGLIMPCLNMDEAGGKESCRFLDEKGRCSIHEYRPGICRIFPLGRVYDGVDFKYFLQTGECTNGTRSKIKVKKWIDAPKLSENQQFIADWHYHIRGLQEKIKTLTDEKEIKNISMTMLMKYYLTPYDINADFYSQFYERFKTER